MRGSDRFIFKLRCCPTGVSVEEFGLLLSPHVTAAMKRVTICTTITIFVDSEDQNIWSMNKID
jgi:hypothetical protein